MATPNEYQKKWIEDKGLSLEALTALPQDQFDVMIPAGSSAPSAPKKERKPAPAPALQPSAAKKKPDEGEDIVFKAIEPEKDIGQPIRIPRETRLGSAEESFVSSRSKTPEGFRGTTEEIEEEGARAAAIKSVPFTPGGVPRQPFDIPFTDIPVVSSPEKTKEILKREYSPEDGWKYDLESKAIEFNQMLVGAKPKTGWLGVAASLAPSVIASSKEAKEADQTKFDASLMAAHQFSNYYESLADKAKEAGDAGGEEKLRNKAKMYRSEMDMDLVTKSEFVARRNSLLAQEIPWDPNYDVYSKRLPKPVTESAKEAVGTAGLALAEEAFMKRGPGGTLIESAPAHLGRVLSAPVSAGVGVAEAISPEKELKETVPGRIEEGLGVMGAGVDIGDAIADELELEEDSPGRTALNICRWWSWTCCRLHVACCSGPGFGHWWCKGISIRCKGRESPGPGSWCSCRFRC
jgi:hypothetical protein